jgi:hypothetical protein
MQPFARQQQKEHRMAAPDPDKRPAASRTVADNLNTMSEALQQQMVNMPLLKQAQQYWQRLQEMHDWWPLLLPLLAWVGWRTYRKERAQVLRARRASGQRQS